MLTYALFTLWLEKIYALTREIVFLGVAPNTRL